MNRHDMEKYDQLQLELYVAFFLILLVLIAVGLVIGRGSKKYD